MRLENGGYVLLFRDGGIEVRRDGRLLYYNRRPMFVTVKTAFAVNEFYDRPYDHIAAAGGGIVAGGVIAVPSGSAFAFTDTYEAAGDGFKVSRRVIVTRAADDLGFSTKFSLVTAESDDPRDYWCFAPGVWYKQNEFAPDTAIGKDLDCEYFWRMETCYALPLFAMQHIRSGETAALSRWAADMTMPSTDILRAENHTDPKCTTGAIGMSRPESRTLNYMYYGFPVAQAAGHAGRRAVDRLRVPRLRRGAALAEPVPRARLPREGEIVPANQPSGGSRIRAALCSGYPVRPL